MLWQMNVYYSFFQKKISDDDECALGTDTCAHTCQDTPGSYTCGCRPGYAINADGRACDGMG